MKVLTLIFCLFTCHCVFAQGFTPEKIEGKVVEVFIGELDPYVGDYCVITIKDRSSGLLYGLVSDEGPRGPVCDDADSIQKGWIVGAYRPAFRLLRNSDLIDALQDYSRMVSRKDRVFFLKYRDSLRFLEQSY